MDVTPPTAFGGKRPFHSVWPLSRPSGVAEGVGATCGKAGCIPGVEPGRWSSGRVESVPFDTHASKDQTAATCAWLAVRMGRDLRRGAREEEAMVARVLTGRGTPAQNEDIARWFRDRL